MHAFASFNAKIISSGEIQLNAISSGAFYGSGVFTTAAIYDRQPFLWEKHWKRLSQNAETVGIDLPDLPEETVAKALSEIIDHNDVEIGRARITVFDESASSIWANKDNNKTSLLIITADLSEAKDLSLTVSPYRINSMSPLAGVKSCNYLENLLALENAKSRGFDEAVRLNERGEVCSASLSNLFWIKDGRIFTPALETGCLAGTTREYLIENFFAQEKIASADELIKAEEIFLTSAGIGIAGVGKFETRPLQNFITSTLRDKAFPFRRSSS